MVHMPNRINIWCTSLIAFIYGAHAMHMSNYAYSSSGDAYSDRQLTPNFEFSVEIFCVPTCFHMRIPKSFYLSVRLSVPRVCPYPDKRNHPSIVNISSTVVIIDTSMEQFSRVLFSMRLLYGACTCIANCILIHYILCINHGILIMNELCQCLEIAYYVWLGYIYHF